MTAMKVLLFVAQVWEILTNFFNIKKKKPHVTPPPFCFFPFPFQDYLNLHSKTCQDSQARVFCSVLDLAHWHHNTLFLHMILATLPHVLELVPPSACRPEAQKKRKYLYVGMVRE